MKYVLLCISFLVFLSFCEGKTHFQTSNLKGYAPASYAPWTPVDWRTLPRARPEEVINVYYLVAPLLETSYGKILADVDAYHGAIGFYNTATGFSVTLNYDANDFFRSNLFPFIEQAPNGTKSLSWDNGGGSFIYLGINETFWTEIDLVAQIPGTIFNRYISEWNSKINSTYLYYDLFSVMDHWGGTTFISGWTCFDFVWASFAILHEWGVNFNTSSLSRDYFILYSANPPVNVTDLFESDPATRQEIIDFYELITASWGDLSWWELVWNLYDVFGGTFYARHGTEYWKLDLHFPYFAFDYVSTPLPGF